MDRFRSPLELDLLRWSFDHWEDPLEAIMAKWGDWEYEKRCLGAVFRKRAKDDRGWFFWAVENSPREVLALAPYLGKWRWADWGLPDYWGEIPGRMGWKEYVKAVGICHESF